MSEEQLKLLNKIGISPDTDLDEIEEAVGNHLTLNCMDENYVPNEEGLICESILDRIGSRE